MQPIQAHISLQYISQLPPRLGPCHPCLTALHFKVAPHLGLLSPMPHCNTFHNYPLPWAPVTYASLQYISQLPLTLGPCHPCLTAIHFSYSLALGPVTHASLHYISKLPLTLGPCHPCLTAIHFTVAPHLGPVAHASLQYISVTPLPWAPVTHASLNTIHSGSSPWDPVTHASLQYISQLPLALGPCHPCLTAMHFTVAPLPWVPVTHASLQCISQLPPCCGPLSPMPHCTTFHSYPLALGPCHPCLTALHFTVAPGCWPVTRGTRSKMA